ncbi:MAG TPA: glycosyltransferase, partial [Acidimicrobiia bacterium]
MHHWSIAAAMRPGEARTLGRVSDAELAQLLASASCVVVPSFDEGLSLPVIEALRAGVPVVASDIPAHRELIGSGAFSCDPRSPRSIAQAVRKARGSATIRAHQASQLARHRHATLEEAIAASITQHLPDATTSENRQAQPTSAPTDRLSVGIATPWPPQRSGVADYSQAVFTELAALADVTVYTTADGLTNNNSDVTLRSVSEVFDAPQEVQQRHDAFISVVGNSHYHLLPVELLQHIDATVIAHDTRMVEFYMALRGKGGAERVMATVPDGTAKKYSTLSLDDQIDDMRLLTNAGLWEVANRAQRLILHSPSAAPTISEQTGTNIRVLPFANYRAPDFETITDQNRAQARARLGLDEYPAGTIHLGSFGYVDLRTKLTDIVVESAAWLTQWGHPVALHLVGSANSGQEAQLREQAQRAGLEHFQITGYITDEQYRDWVLAVDLGVQLRISPLLGVSGPLSDFAAYGTPAVASKGLCIDVDTPPFIYRLPDAVSPVIVAEAIEQTLANPTDPQDLET